MSSLRSLRCGGCYPGSLSGACWLAIGELLFLWPPGFGAVPSLHVSHLSLVRSVFFLSPRSWRCFPYLGWVCFWSSLRFLYLRLRVWASACVGPHGYPTFSRVGAASSTWVPLLCPGCGGFLLLCLPSGWGHPFGSLVSFVTIDRQ